jgi:hypothetical protein
MPFETTLESYFQYPKIGNTNLVDKQTCEVGSTIAPLAIGSYNDV